MYIVCIIGFDSSNVLVSYVGLVSCACNVCICVWGDELATSTMYYKVVNSKC